MPYVRARGGQVLIVHGVRRPAGGSVEQKILYTFYSRSEADDFLRGPRIPDQVRAAHPNLRFDWKALRSRVRELAETLPEGDDATKRVGTSFRNEVVALAGTLASVDPEIYKDARTLVIESAPDLRALRALIDELLDVASTGQPRAPGVGRLGRAVQPSLLASELVDELAGDDDGIASAELLGLLVRAFPDWAYGHARLGDHAGSRQSPEVAVEQYTRAAEILRGRRPQRGSDEHKLLRRVLADIASTELERGRHARVLAIAEEMTALSPTDHWPDQLRAPALLSLGRYRLALEAAERFVGLDPLGAIYAALAAAEAKQTDDATRHACHAAIALPLTVRVLVGGGRSKVESHEDSEEVVLARRIRTDLSTYLEKSKDGMKRLAVVANHPKVAELAAEHRVLRRRWREERGADRRVFDRMSEMRSGTAATEVARRAFGVPERARRAATPVLH